MTDATRQPEHPLIFGFPDEHLEACSQILDVVISANRDEHQGNLVQDGTYRILRMVQDVIEYEARSKRPWSGCNQ